MSARDMILAEKLLCHESGGGALTDTSDASPGIESPRVLRLTFEIHIPKGLRRNVQFRRVEQAADRITGAVQGAVASAFPWADRIKVRKEWSYAWADWSEEIVLPSSEENTITVSGETA
jgi:hypothetical protein